MGFAQEIETNGIFPTVSSTLSEQEFEQIQAKTLEGWTNYESAEMEEDELRKLVQDYADRGFCHLVPDLAERELGRAPILNRLAVIVKAKVNDDGETQKKSRIVWDLRRSGANAVCKQTERILLPRLLDVAAHVLEQYRKGQEECWLAAVDIRDAFMNIPVMQDRFALAAVVPVAHQDQRQQILVFDTLVFGAASAPTIWGRYAAFLGRTISAIQPQTGCQIYVDDPIFTLTGPLHQAARQLAVILLWLDTQSRHQRQWEVKL